MRIEKKEKSDFKIEVWKEALRKREQVKENVKKILNLLTDCEKDPPSLFSTENQKLLDNSIQEILSAIGYLESCTTSRWALRRISAIRSLINQWYGGFLPNYSRNTFDRSNLDTLRSLARHSLTSANNILVDMDYFKIEMDEPKTVKRSIEEFIIDHAVGFVITVIATAIATWLCVELFGI